jgi:hypothetical protein
MTQRELSEKNDWRREYDRQRWPRRKAEIIEYLGAQCATCGSAEGPFDFDHVDPSTKAFTISDRPTMASTASCTRCRSLAVTQPNLCIVCQ